MKFLVIPLISLALVACGGGTEPFASTPVAAIKATAPAPVKKATTVTGGNAVVIHMYQALYGMAPSNALLVDYAFQANNDASTFVGNLTDRFATTSHADLAKLVLDNLGVTAATVPSINAKGESEYALLLDAVKQLFGAYPTMRGQVIMNMANLLAGLESDATYGGAATIFDKQTSANFTYSSNPANLVTAVVKPPPAPIINVTLSKAKATVGSSVMLTWSSTNATSCMGLDDVTAGTQAKSGSMTITPTVGGQFAYTISCDGAGGTAKNSALLIVPMPVQKTSYLNAKNINIPSQKYPSFSQLDHRADHNDNLGAGVAFADFFQEGKISMVWFTNRGAYPGPGNPPGTVKFFKFDSDGNPIEYTSAVLTDTTGCSSPRKLLVADFNGDGRPDIFASCHGVEYGTPWPGEHPRVLLSQPDGTYTNVETALNCYCHGAAAADINGDGFVDVLTSDERVNMPGSNVESDITSMVALINDGHGNFTVNRNYTNIIPAVPALDPSVPGGVSNWFTKTSSFSMELVDVDGDGQPDLIFGTSDDLHFPSRVFINKNGRFDEITTSIQTGIPGFWAIDILARDRNVYLYGIANYNTTYDYVVVYKYNLSTGIGGIIYNSNGKQWPNGNSPQDLIWIMPYNGYIVPYSDAYDGVNISM